MMPSVIRRLSVLVPVLFAAGCAAALPPPTLYVLQTVTGAASAGGQGKPLAVALGPVTVPDYLDRTDIVRRASDNRLAINDTERWAETLRAGVLRVLGADLSDRLGPRGWVGTGSSRSGPSDFEVPVDIDGFEQDAGGRVVLIASWEVRASRDDRQPVRRRTRYERTVSGPTTDEQVRALSATLGDLATDIAVALTAAQK